MLEDEDDGGDDGGDNGVDDGDDGGVAGLNSNDVDDNDSGGGIVRNDGGGGGGDIGAAVGAGGDDDGGGVTGLNSNVDGGVVRLIPNDVDDNGSGGGIDDDDDAGGGGGGIGAAVGAADRRFSLSTNLRSLSANGGVIRLRVVAVVVAVFSSSSLSLSYASRSCMSPLCIYRQDNKRHTCLITVSNIVLTCISTGYGRSDRVCHIETPLHFPKPLLQRYDNPTQDVHDKTGRRYVILIFR